MSSKTKIVAVTAAFLTLGCFVPKTIAPFPLDFSGPPEETERLLLMLPGMGDRVGDFRDRGFFELAETHRDRLGSTTLVAVDAHFGYYRQRSLLARMEQDVFARFPDHRVSVMGISLGGFGALLTARRFVDRIDEVILFAPYLGDPPFIDRIREEGLADKPGDDDKMRELVANWRFLTDPPPNGPRVLVAVGKDDPLKPAVDLLLEKAPHVRIMVMDGGHRWTTWKPLWEKWLQQRKP